MAPSVRPEAIIGIPLIGRLVDVACPGYCGEVVPWCHTTNSGGPDTRHPPPEWVPPIAGPDTEQVMDDLGNALLVFSACFALVIVGVLTPQKTIVLRTLRAWRDCRYKRAWLRQMAWEHQHPVQRVQAGAVA